jgi:signal transduction histidine kinase
MWRLLAAFLLVATALHPHSARADQPDFITEMTRDLAVDPVTAVTKADREIARLEAVAGSQDGNRLAQAYWVRAQAAFRLGDSENARRFLAKASSAASTRPGGARVRGYVQLLDGLLARSEGNLGDALLSFGGAHRSFITAQDRRGQALALQSIGVLYSDVGAGDDAARYLELSRDAYPEHDIVFKLSLNNNYGVVEQTRYDFTAAERYFLVAREAASELGSERLALQISLNIISARLQIGNVRGAQALIAEIERNRSSLSSPQLRELQRLRAWLALDQGRAAEALNLIQGLLVGVDRETSTSADRSLLLVAYRIFRQAGRQGEALAYLEAVRRLDAADAQIVSSNRAALLAAQFQFEAQNTRIAELKAEGLEREVNYQRTVTLVLVAGGLIVLALLVGLLVIAIRARNRARADGVVLAQTNRDLERALAAKTEFLASTSHELRTPLNGILGMTQVMLTDPAATPRLRTQIELLHDAGTAMRALVDDILDVAKIEHGGFTITPKPTDADALIRRVVRLFEADASKRGLELHVDAQCGGQLELDPDRLTQILFNLVGNAMKFTQQGSITVRAERSGDHGALGETLSIAVTDTGIGIAPEWHATVFEMFRQVDGTRTRHYGGTGLGLAICRQLARAMGGDIALESAPGEGSTFRVTLPAIPVALEQPSVHAEGESEGFGECIGDSLVPPEADLAVIAVDPLRVAMLAAIARRAGRKVWIADTSEKIAAAFGRQHLTLLVDEAAMHSLASMLGACSDGERDMILVGEGATAAESAAFGVGRVVPFSRNALAEALDPAPSRETATLHHLPTGRVSRGPAAQSGRMARVSRA